MRINGFEQIKAFYSWVFNNPDKVRPTHISLYLFLWNQGNRANWVEWFKCPYDLAMQGACIGNKGTYYRCLDDLQKFKLIKYKKGLNNYKAPQIHLIKLYENEPLTEQVTVPLSEPQTEPLIELLSGNIYKLLTTNYKLINSNLPEWINNHNNLDIKYYRKFAHLKLSIEEFNKLNEKYTKEQIDDCLDKIENYKKNTSYKSLYLTLNNWLKKDKEKSSDKKESFSESVLGKEKHDIILQQLKQQEEQDEAKRLN
jgi:hypothetical protein